MQLLHPWALAGLLLVGAVVLLHVFRSPGRREPVSSLDLWRRVLLQVRPEATERLKRFDWLLLVEVLVVTLLVLALAWPVVWRERPHRNVGIILDTSASMNTIEPGGKTRLDEWRKVHDTLVSRLSAQDDLGVFEPGPKGSDLVVSPEKFLTDGLARFGATPQVIFLITDKPPAKIDDPRVRVVAVGGPSRNAGIVAFSGTPAADGSVEVFVRVKNYADAAASHKLVATNAAKTLWSESLDIPSMGSVEKVFSVRLAADDPVLRVKLEGADDGFAADDEVAGVLKPMLVVATGVRISPAYARLFGGAVFEGTVYAEIPAAQSSAVPRDSLVIASGVVPESFGALAVLDNAPAGRVADIVVGSEKRLDRAVSPIAASDDPFLRSVNLAGLKLDRFRPLQLPETARPLLRIGADVVAASQDLGDAKVVVLGFDATRAEWTLKPSFVIFWTNVFAEAKKRSGAGGLVAYRTGDVVPLAIGTQATVVTGPTGQVQVKPSASGWADFMPSTVGVYSYEVSGRRHYFAANLLSEVESDNRPSPLVGKPPSFDLPAPLAGKSIPLAPWLCLLAAGLAVVWWHYRR